MDKYLLDILKEHSTIIIPGLGALTITNSDTGETMFMPYLQHDDGKLAEFVAEKDGLEEADARIMVSRYVREILATLSKGEPYAMFQLGTFVKSEDGDVEYTHWPNSGPKKVVTETPVVEEEVIIADQPIVEAEPEVIPEPVIEPEPVIIPEPIVESEPVIEPEPVIIPEPIVNDIPEPDFSAEEIEIKNTISEALENTPKVKPPVVEAIKTSVIHDVTLEPSAGNEHNADSAPIDAEIVGTVPPADGMSGEEVEKEKPSTKFWIYLILIAILIIGGGAYIGRNYNELKQHIPFLADKEEAEVKSKPVLDEMDDIIKSGQNENSNDGDEREGSDILDENDGANNGIDEETPVQPEPTVKPEPSPTPIASSSGGHYHIIAGAFSSEENATNLANEFKAKGLGSSVVKNGALNAVSMQSYATSEEAKADLSRMNAMAPGAWILYK
jgi:nucleoid DNA-binding protein